MYLSGDKVWVADPGILVIEVAEVTRHAAPCPPRPDTAYLGRSLASTMQWVRMPRLYVRPTRLVI